MQSSHKAIQLIACVSCPFLGKHGFETILEPFVKDVNILAKVITTFNDFIVFIVISYYTQDGLVLQVDGVEKRFYGTLLVMLADTLVAHDLNLELVELYINAINVWPLERISN